MRVSMSTLMHYGLWGVVLIIALFLQVIPVFLLVTMFGLAVGVPKGPALILIPLVVIAIIVTACMAATRFTERRSAPSGAARHRRDGEPPWRVALASKTVSPSEYFRNLKRLD